MGGENELQDIVSRPNN